MSSQICGYMQCRAQEYLATRDQAGELFPFRAAYCVAVVTHDRTMVDISELIVCELSRCIR